MKVAVLKGGRSLERGVSLRSAARVADALERLGHEVLEIDVGSDLVERLSAERPEAAFIAMHGPGGEDGTVQELLEILGIPYTGPGVAACARCMDKVAAKHILREAGIPTPDWFAFNETAFGQLGAADALGEIVRPARVPARRQARQPGVLAGGQVRLGGGRAAGGPGRGLQLRRPGRARELRRGAGAGGRGARLRAAADRRGDPAGERRL